MTDRDRPDLPPPRDPDAGSEVIPGGPVFQRLEESAEIEPSPLRKHAVPLVGILVLVTLATVTSMDWRGWMAADLVPPRATFNRVDFRGLDDERLAVDLFVDVTNPNDFGAQVLDYTLALSVAGATLTRERVERVVDFRGGVTGELLIPLKLQWADLEPLIRRDEVSGRVPESLPFTLDLSATVAVPGSSVMVPFSHTGELPVVVPPRVAPCDFGVARDGVNHVRIEVDLCIRNPNARPIGLSGLRYEVRLNDRTLVEAALGEEVQLEAGGGTRVPVIGRMTVEQAGRRLVAALLGVKTDTDVRVIGSGEFATGIGVIPLHFDNVETMAPETK